MGSEMCIRDSLWGAFCCCLCMFFRQSTWRCSNSPRKKSREFPPVCECFLVLVTDASVGRVLGGAQIVPEKKCESFLLSKNVCWCWLRMLLLAEYVPVTMLDPQAIGTAFQKKQQKVRMELHILTFIEQCSGLQGRRRCLAAGVLDIWHGTDPPDLGTARHRTSLVQLFIVFYDV